MRQLIWELGESNACVVHLTLVPFLKAAGELKTKPTQHSVKSLLELGVQPDVLVLRTEQSLGADLKKKLALFCNVQGNAVIEARDLSTIYEVPMAMLKEKLDKVVLNKLKLKSTQEPELSQWSNFLFRLEHPKSEVKIALVGKYVELPDAYKSINESFIHAGAANECEVKVTYIHSEFLTEENVASKLSGYQGILVAPGFGNRGIEGKVLAVKYARENKVPFFGICLGMQISVIEFARNMAGISDAHSSEMSDTPNAVIDLMEEQKKITNYGGTMRLGAYDCELIKGSHAAKAYGKTKISERHRHRYEFNNNFKDAIQNAGMKITGTNPQTGLAEVVEAENHPWFVGVQFHPELKSTVENPHPLFVAFVAAAMKNG
jgi:CTP synthase